MLTIIVSLVALSLVVYLILKKYDPTFVLMTVGMGLMLSAVLMGKGVFPPDSKASTGHQFLDIFKAIQQSFVSQLGIIGLTIMTLFGFSSYMSYIGANDATINALIKPVKKVGSVYILVPLVFIMGNLLSIVVPSASSLALILMATLYPTLKKAKMSSLTAAGIIATTATIMPTPLGADNVIVAEKLGIDLMDYVFRMHAMISIPSLLVMAVAHFFWQRFMDKRNSEESMDVDIKDDFSTKELPPFYYGIFPILPLLILLLAFVLKNNGIISLNVDVVTVTFISFILAAIVEMIRKKSYRKVAEDSKIFFKGMGDGMASVVTLVVAAGVLVEGFKAVGVIDLITSSVENVKGAGLILSMAFTGATTLIGIISGSGLSFFYAMIGVVPEISRDANINGVLISLPMQMAANLSRTLSPVAAVIIIVAGNIKRSPIDVLKRTAIPTLAGLISVIVLTNILLF